MTAGRPCAAALLALAALAAAPPARGQGATTCARDVLVAQSMQRQALDRLEEAGGGDAERCRTWRGHVETMRRVAVVYGRCLAGPERADRLAQVTGSEREFAAAIRERCRGP